jgi:hypothetical protein
MEWSDRISSTLSLNLIAASISSRILSPIRRSCGTNQHRPPCFQVGMKSLDKFLICQPARYEAGKFHIGGQAILVHSHA